jgi:hypothetical protein
VASTTCKTIQTGTQFVSRMPNYRRDLPRLSSRQYDCHSESEDSDAGSFNEESVNPWTTDSAATLSRASTPDLLPADSQVTRERLYFEGDDEEGRLRAIMKLLEKAQPETIEAVSVSLRSHTSCDTPTLSLASLLDSMEEKQMMTQQAHPQHRPFYRCKSEDTHPDSYRTALLGCHNLELGDVAHPHPHDWLVVPTQLKLAQLRLGGTRKYLDEDFDDKFQHGVNWLTRELKVAEKAGDCDCRRWYPYAELKDLTGLGVLCRVGRSAFSPFGLERVYQ